MAAWSFRRRSGVETVHLDKKSSLNEAIQKAGKDNRVVKLVTKSGQTFIAVPEKI